MICCVMSHDMFVFYMRVCVCSCCSKCVCVCFVCILLCDVGRFIFGVFLRLWRAVCVLLVNVFVCCV